jgi:hypothetical protein
VPGRGRSGHSAAALYILYGESLHECICIQGGIRTALHENCTGLVQIVGQLYGSNRDTQPKCRAKSRDLGQPCAIFVSRPRGQPCRHKFPVYFISDSP